MINFKHYKFLKENMSIFEAVDVTDQLKHLYHNEEHIINAGKVGYNHARDNLISIHNMLSGIADSSTRVTVKIDGSPSLVAGYHPVNKKFFVATKSAFNKTPKINYTKDDIKENHGHAPGLMAKLYEALEYLPQVMPKRGIYQGDVLFGKGDKRNVKDGGISFTPNTITYTIAKGHPDYDKVNSAKFGIAWHTIYSGKPDSDHHINGMTAGFNVNQRSFKNSRDVYTMSPEINAKNMIYDEKLKKRFERELKNAEAINGKISNEEYDAVVMQADVMKAYFNVKVRDGGDASASNYKETVGSKLYSDADKMKSDKGKISRLEKANEFEKLVTLRKSGFDKIIKMHDHLQLAKDALVDALSSYQDFEHTVNGKQVKPEGFVIIKNSLPTKLVDRKEFSKLNFANNRGR